MSQTFQPIITIYRKVDFVYHHCGCKSINRQLSYPTDPCFSLFFKARQDIFSSFDKSALFVNSNVIVCNESNNSEMFICSAYPVQVSGHQLVSVPVSSTSAMYQTVMANIHSAESNQVQVWSLLCFNFVFMGVFPESLSKIV